MSARVDTHCKCWTEAARTHDGHCCVQEDLWCHQSAGMAALANQQDTHPAEKTA